MKWFYKSGKVYFKLEDTLCDTINKNKKEKKDYFEEENILVDLKNGLYGNSELLSDESSEIQDLLFSIVKLGSDYDYCLLPIKDYPCISVIGCLAPVIENYLRENKKFNDHITLYNEIKLKATNAKKNSEDPKFYYLNPSSKISKNTDYIISLFSQAEEVDGKIKIDISKWDQDPNTGFIYGKKLYLFAGTILKFYEADEKNDKHSFYLISRLKYEMRKDGVFVFEKNESIIWFNRYIEKSGLKDVLDLSELTLNENNLKALKCFMQEKPTLFGNVKLSVKGLDFAKETLRLLKNIILRQRKLTIEITHINSLEDQPEKEKFYEILRLLSSVKEVNLSRNNLNCFPKVIPELLKKDETIIQYLDLSFNNLGMNKFTFGILADLILNCSSLKKLNLESNLIDSHEENIEKIVVIINSEDSKLDRLDLTSNCLENKHSLTEAAKAKQHKVFVIY